MVKRTDLPRKIDSLVEDLKASYGAERIILYGSHSSGNTANHGDVDLVVIKRTSRPFFDRLRDVARACHWHDAVDVLVYTPEEYENLRNTNWFVREEIEKKGQLIYESGS